MTPPPVIHGMIEAALKAAHIALLRRKNDVQVIRKPDGSFVTSGDYQAQQIIEAELRKISPSALGVEAIYFLCEESLDGKAHDFAGRKKGAHWVIDPIDGTIGYKQKRGDAEPKPWAVSIGLEQDGKTIAAVVYEASPGEYGTVAADFDGITPQSPQGNIFWAHRDVPHAHRLEGHFRVTPAHGSAYAEQANGDGLMTLTYPLPELAVDYSGAAHSVLNETTPLPAGATHLIDGFYQDKQPGAPAGAPLKRRFLQGCDLGEGEYQSCFSSVAGAMQAASGRARSFMVGGGFPWDVSAARLILEKSATALAEYAMVGAEGVRTLMIAGRDLPMFERMKNSVETMQDHEASRW
ncbi:MAG: inositol monophosphatase family protein [Alphaproteobacteria bacterium]|nr:inositol monophosphatase family protein [Alphaproteobacteria bacterium]